MTGTSAVGPPVLGIDIGGTSTEAVVVTDGVVVVGRARVPTEHGGPEQIMATVLEASRLAIAEATVDSVAAVGVGVPGIVDDAAGSTRHAVNLGIDEDAFAIGPTLSLRLGVPSHVENDARAAAHGAFTLARTANPGLRSLAYVSVGTGISAGFVLDGELYRGSGGIAGEIGHVVADPAGPRCACGLDGCLEAIASGGAAGREGDGHGMTALFEAADAGDPGATSAAGVIAIALARALYGLVLSYDVEQIVVGGGVMHHTPALVAAIGNALADIEAASPLAADLSPPPGSHHRPDLCPSGPSAPPPWPAVGRSTDRRHTPTTGQPTTRRLTTTGKGSEDHAEIPMVSAHRTARRDRRRMCGHAEHGGWRHHRSTGDGGAGHHDGGDGHHSRGRHRHHGRRGRRAIPPPRGRHGR